MFNDYTPPMHDWLSFQKSAHFVGLCQVSSLLLTRTKRNSSPLQLSFTLKNNRHMSMSREASEKYLQCSDLFVCFLSVCLFVCLLACLHYNFVCIKCSLELLSSGVGLRICHSGLVQCRFTTTETVRTVKDPGRPPRL